MTAAEGAAGSELGAVEQPGEARQHLLAEIHKTVIGQADVIEELLISLFCQGDCLLVGVRGLARRLWCGRWRGCCGCRSAGSS